MKDEARSQARGNGRERTRTENRGIIAYFYDNQYVKMAEWLDREHVSTYIVLCLALTGGEC